MNPVQLSLGVGNGNFDTLPDRETIVFLCEPKTS